MHNHRGCFVSGTDAIVAVSTWDQTLRSASRSNKQSSSTRSLSRVIGILYLARLNLKTNRHRAHRLCQSMYANQIGASLGIRAHILKRDIS